jgi:hypothetical protein
VLQSTFALSSFQDEEMTNPTTKIEAWANQAANVVHTTQQQQEVASEDGDSYGTVTAFIVGLDEVVVRLDSGIARLISCTSDEELMHSVSGLQRHTPLLVISPGSLPRSVAAHPELIHHFTFLNRASLPRYPPIYDEHKSNVYSDDHLMAELYDKLGQHYQDRAIRASIEFNDQHAAKDLLEKSARCYELVECDTETTLKQYADILKKTFF